MGWYLKNCEFFFFYVCGRGWVKVVLLVGYWYGSYSFIKLVFVWVWVVLEVEFRVYIWLGFRK